jgi:hypothetical protein
MEYMLSIHMAITGHYSSIKMECGMKIPHAAVEQQIGSEITFAQGRTPASWTLNGCWKWHPQQGSRDAELKVFLPVFGGEQ